ncbi:MAG TPA: hypothetical protein VEJ88_05150 [Dissulfurispiraceae bacterium]|nr:hypothetical protein [Dissulfurispiraceae bacterium]
MPFAEPGVKTLVSEGAEQSLRFVAEDEFSGGNAACVMMEVEW